MNKYLIISESNYLINTELNKIVNEDYIIDNYNLEDCSIDDIIEDGSYLSLFEDEKKCIIIRTDKLFSTKLLTDKEIKKLESFLIDSNNLIIFVTPKIKLKNEIYEYFKNNFKVLELKNYKYNDLVNFVIKEFEKDGYKINNIIINYIIDSCLQNMDLIINEIEKIKLYFFDNKIIDYNKVTDLVPTSLDSDIFKFVNAVIDKKINNSLKYLNDLVILKKDPVGLLGALANNYRNILIVKYYLGLKYKEVEIVKELNIHPYTVKVCIKNSYNYSIRELKNKLMFLGKLDYEIKTGVIEPNNALLSFLINI